MNPIKRSIAAAGRRWLVARPLLALAAIGLVFALSSAAWACPGCKEALASGDGTGGDLVSGFFWSILFMLSMPFLIFGTFCGSMYFAVRRARAKQATTPVNAAQPAAANDAPGRTASAGGQSLVGA